MQDDARQIDDGPDAVRVTGGQLCVYCGVNCRDAPIGALSRGDALADFAQMLADCLAYHLVSPARDQILRLLQYAVN